MRSAFALRIFSGKIIYKFGIPERLRTLRDSIFTGRGREGKRHLQRLLPAEAAALRGSGLALSVTYGDKRGNLARERLRGFASKQCFLQFMEYAQVFSFFGLTAYPGICIL